MWVPTVTAVLLTVSIGVSSLPSSRTSESLKFVSEAMRRSSANLGKNPEVDMNTTELIRNQGFPVEKHEVVTEDGYILGLFRIPHGRKNKDMKGPRPVALLQHGLFGICDNFLVNPANESIGFILADAGVDVWMGNNRGNRHSRRHVSLDPESLDFWKFSWDEMAQYDLPATIYYVLNQTGAEQLYYVGHSQGTAIGFAKFSEDQVLASRVKHFLAMAPIGRVGHTTSPIRLLVPFSEEIEFFFNVFGHGELNVPAPIMRAIAGTLCQEWGATLCMDYMFVFCGFNAKSFNRSRADVYLTHATGGGSSMTLLQWGQNVRTGQFQHYDHGEKENLARYGQKTPPLYHPKKVKVPVAIFRGGHDMLADNRDVEWLLPQLNVTHDIYIPFYEHLDPGVAVDAAELLFKDLVNIIKGKE